MRDVPNTPDGFRQRLYSRKDTLDQLRVRLKQLPAEQMGEALLDVFTDTAPTADRYGDQQAAGRLLVVSSTCGTPLAAMRWWGQPPDWSATIQRTALKRTHCAPCDGGSAAEAGTAGTQVNQTLQ